MATRVATTTTQGIVAAAIERVRTTPVLVAMALATLMAEAPYPLTVSMTLRVVAQRTALGHYAEERVIFVIIGAFLLPLPLVLTGVVTRALLAPRYLQLQAPPAVGGPRTDLVALALLELATTAIVPAAGIAGAAPGLVLVLAGGMKDVPQTLLLGAVVAMLGASIAVIYALPGVAFATRMAVLSGFPPRDALRRNWDWAEGQRKRLFLTLFPSYAVESAGVVGVFLFLVGAIVTLPIGRALRDALITQAYLTFAPAKGPGRAPR